MEKFVEKVQKMAEKQKKGKKPTFVSRVLKKWRKTVAFCRKQKFIHEDAYEINEVEQLRILFSQFFLQYSKINQKKVSKTKLKKLDVKANEEDKKTIKILQSKLVMMITENISKN